MNISKISSVNPRFSGVFKEVRSTRYVDNEQRYECVDIHSIYYPNKNESEKDIAKAMKAYTRIETSSDSSRPDGGHDRFGNYTVTQGWASDTNYTCERGERLPY